MVSKKYQNISKNFKNCQRWQMHRAGSPSTHGAAPYAPEVCSGGQDTASSPLKTFTIYRDSEGVRPWLELPLQVWDQWSEILANSSES